MLPPSMDYEVGKGRMFELEQKAAARRQVEEALAGKRRQQERTVRPSLLQRIKGVFAPARREDAGPASPGRYHEQKQPTAP